jgi:hypothetical protein
MEGLAGVSLTQLIQDAQAMGLQVSGANGRIRIEGRLGDVKKAFAAQGCNVVDEGCKTVRSFVVFKGTERKPSTHVACIGALLGSTDAYAFTTSA